MLTIVRRGAALREKPPEVVRGMASRLPWAWDGLCFGVPLTDANRDSARDIVANAAPSEWVGSPGWTTDNRGNVAANLGFSTYMGWPNNPQHNQPSTAMTLHLRLRRTAVIPAPRGICGKVYSQGVDPFVTWGLNTSDNNPHQFAGSITVNGALTFIDSATQTYTSDTSTWLSIFLRWRSGIAPFIQIVGENGQFYQTISNGVTVAGTLSYPSASLPIRFNTADDPNSGGTYSAAWSQMLLWSRMLSDSEVQALVSDPYGWYSPRRETIGLSSPYPLVAGAGEMKFGTGSGGLR